MPYRKLRTDKIWHGTGVTTTASTGTHVWFLTNNTLASSTQPPANSIHRIYLGGAVDRVVVELAFKITAVGTQTLATGSGIRGVSAIQYTRDAATDYLASTILERIPTMAGSAAGEHANGEAGMMVGSGLTAVIQGTTVVTNNMDTDLCGSVPYLITAAGRTPVANDFTRGKFILGERLAGATGGGGGGITANPFDSLGGAEELALGLKYIATFTAGGAPSVTLNGQILVHLLQHYTRTGSF